jgi:hypothetical protein
MGDFENARRDKGEGHGPHARRGQGDQASQAIVLKKKLR